MNDSARPTVLWVLTDEKPGHRSQQEGLVERLQALAPFEVHWIAVAQLSVSLGDLLRRRPLLPHLPRPDWVLGAGSGTHRWLLGLKWIFGARTILLMKGNFPPALFDANITPAHDNPPRRDNLLITTGVLNPVRPRYEGRDGGTGTFLIGGISEHYAWDDAALMAQVERICQARPAVRWTLTDSRRTPAAFLPALQARSLANLTLISHRDTPRGFIGQQLEETGQLWVTRDSVSMVYEGITAGVPTGLLDLKPLRESRVVMGMNRLLAQGWVQDVGRQDLSQPLPPAPARLWEADRAARWLLARLG